MHTIESIYLGIGLVLVLVVLGLFFRGSRKDNRISELLDDIEKLKEELHVMNMVEESSQEEMVELLQKLTSFENSQRNRESVYTKMISTLTKLKQAEIDCNYKEDLGD